MIKTGLQGIYISRIQEDSLAEKCGLTPGDQILSTNYTSFLDGITCQQAFRIICENECLLLNVLPRHEALSHQRRHHCYAWIDSDGRPTSPPPPDRDIINDSSSLEQQISQMNSSPFRRKSHCNAINDVRQVSQILFYLNFINFFIKSFFIYYSNAMILWFCDKWLIMDLIISIKAITNKSYFWIKSDIKQMLPNFFLMY